MIMFYFINMSQTYWMTVTAKVYEDVVGLRYMKYQEEGKEYTTNKKKKKSTLNNNPPPPPSQQPITLFHLNVKIIAVIIDLKKSIKQRPLILESSKSIRVRREHELVKRET